MVNAKKVFYSIMGLVEVIFFVIFLILAMYIQLVILISIICFTLVVIGIIEFKPKEEGKSEVSGTSETISYDEAEGLPEDKIRCPNCNKPIPEGLTFCPECGARIPPEGLFGS